MSRKAKKLGIFEKKLLKYLAGWKNRRTFAPAFEKYTARGHERKSSLKGLHRQRKVVQEASRRLFSPSGNEAGTGTKEEVPRLRRWRSAEVSVPY